MWSEGVTSDEASIDPSERRDDATRRGSDEATSAVITRAHTHIKHAINTSVHPLTHSYWQGVASVCSGVQLQCSTAPGDDDAGAGDASRRAAVDAAAAERARGVP